MNQVADEDDVVCMVVVIVTFGGSILESSITMFYIENIKINKNKV